MNFETILALTFINSMFMIVIIAVNIFEKALHRKPIHLNVALLILFIANTVMFAILVEEHEELRKAAIKFGLVQTEESVSVKKNVWKIK